MRGDRPSCFGSGFCGSTFTPHARGSTCRLPEHTCRAAVYPACAGIDLGSTKNNTIIQSLPRMRGDRPVQPTSSVGYVVFTPHARGSTFDCRISSRVSNVYPACAGIDPTDGEGFGFVTRLPRMRGDRPGIRMRRSAMPKFTPHARGSTLEVGQVLNGILVYPACAGIDPSSLWPPSIT